MSAQFKPMLATDCVLEQLRFPLLASAKLDGVRAIVRDGVVLSRSLKPIPNQYVQEKFKQLEHYDGELVYGPPTAKDCYRRTVSACMGSTTAGKAVAFWAFDHVEHPSKPYSDRVKLRKRAPRVILLAQHTITCMSTLLAYEAAELEKGHEGLILRDAEAPYKYGRSTVREGYLLKLKRFTDAEFEVVGFEERVHNGNTPFTSELGRTKRTSHKAGMSGRGDLGALIVQHPRGFTFNVGTGFSDAERAQIWQSQNKWLGRVVKVKFFAVGVKDAPRFPVFLGLRDVVDV